MASKLDIVPNIHKKSAYYVCSVKKNHVIQEVHAEVAHLCHSQPKFPTSLVVYYKIYTPQCQNKATVVPLSPISLSDIGFAVSLP